MHVDNNGNASVYVMNLPSVICGGFLPSSGTGAGWWPFEYTLDIGSGVGLATGEDSHAGILTLDLKLKGWHRLFIAHNPAIRLWLEGEYGYYELPGDASAVSEVEALCADFTGCSLCMAPVRNAFRAREAMIFFLRAEPCRKPIPGHRNLVATNDGHGIFGRGVDSPQDLYASLYPLRDSDFFRILWGVYGGGPLTLRKGSPFADLDTRTQPSGWYYERDRIYGQSLRHLRQAGVDPLAVVREATREYGLELHYYFRMAAFFGPFPHTSWTTRFFTEHPQWHCRDEFGRPVNMISYAFPQVQDFVLAYFSELLDYDPEGLCLAFNRGLPLMICEEPVLELFRQRHGRDPRLPEENESPELLAVRSELLAGFVKRVYRLVSQRGRALSAILPRNFTLSRLLGLDAADLLRQVPFESVMVGAGHGDMPAQSVDLAPLQALKAAGTRVYAGGAAVDALGGAWRCDLPEQARRMSAILDAGLDGGFFWDADIGRSDWKACQRFGDPSVLDRVAQGAWPAALVHETRSIHGMAVGRYNPWHAY